MSATQQRQEDARLHSVLVAALKEAGIGEGGDQNVTIQAGPHLDEHAIAKKVARILSKQSGRGYN
jgi:hypothetical protein